MDTTDHNSNNQSPGESNLAFNATPNPFCLNKICLNQQLITWQHQVTKQQLITWQQQIKQQQPVTWQHQVIIAPTNHMATTDHTATTGHMATTGHNSDNRSYDNNRLQDISYYNLLYSNIQSDGKNGSLQLN